MTRPEPVAGAVVAARVIGRVDPVPWNSASGSGTIVRLTCTGSECREGAEVDVDEDQRRVVVTVLEPVTATSCRDVGVTFAVTARLEAPVGDRELVTAPASPRTRPGGERR